MGIGFRQVGDLHLFGVPVQALARELTGSDLQILNIGDSAGPRQAPFVIYEGRRAGLAI